MTSGSGYRERNSTADRALTLLEMFTDDRLEVSAAEVAENLGVARSTAYRYLQTLVQSQFLSEDGRGGFRLGMKVLQLARLARQGFGLSEMALPVMRELANEFHQTVLLTRQMGSAIICLEREESSAQYVRFSFERGSILSLNAGASAMVLLAWLPESQARELLTTVKLQRFTSTTLTDPDEILARLRLIKAEGHAFSVGEVDATSAGIAAPIFRPNGEVLAAVSVALVRSRVSDLDVDRITARVVESAALLTEQVAVLDV
ncbi:IclR family transcriptional regulator [Aeromicrobium sp.]|uniref:IclR family transcriptional regulator n=1 Tax=Aeromicrobium sp. TaxID=1871063 RepID=UPI0030BA4C6F